MKKNTTWNRLFHSKEMKAQMSELEHFRLIKCYSPELIKNLHAALTLQEVFNLHKWAWAHEFHKGLGPDNCGIFRTKDIESMIPEEVYLGGIWGLFTQPIPFWEECRNDKYGSNGFGFDPEQSLYKMIVDQYRNHILSNVRALQSLSEKKLLEFAQNGYEVFIQRKPY